jgi:hypothetical protein
LGLGREFRVLTRAANTDAAETSRDEWLPATSASSRAARVVGRRRRKLLAWLLMLGLPLECIEPSGQHVNLAEVLLQGKNLPFQRSSLLLPAATSF